MSVQNNLKKPEFTKTMLGYNPHEVDRYIEYMTERYNAVSRDVSELKRRLTRLQLGLDKTEESENDEKVLHGFSDGAVDHLRHMISAERSRHAESLDALLEFIESHKLGEEVSGQASLNDEYKPLANDDGFAPVNGQAAEDFDLTDEDEEWTRTLSEFIADAAEESESDADGDAKAELSIDIEVDIPAETEAQPAAEDEPQTAKKTPAELARELDFYSDTVIRDGESYDPMTLAQSATMKRRRPTLEDFVNPIGDGDEVKRG